MALWMGPGAQAQCGVSAKMIQPMGWHLQQWGVRPMLLSAGFDEGSNHEPSIIGMWHVVFTGQTMNDGPDVLPEPFDNSVVVWHRDGTGDYELLATRAGRRLLHGRLEADGEGGNISSTTFRGRAMIRSAIPRMELRSWRKSR